MIRYRLTIVVLLGMVANLLAVLLFESLAAAVPIVDAETADALGLQLHAGASDSWIEVRDKEGRTCVLYSETAVDGTRLGRIWKGVIQVHEWESIAVEKIRCHHAPDQDRLVVIPASVTWQGRSLEPFLPSGISLVLKAENTDYAFPLVKGTRLFRLQGKLVSETALLDHVVRVLDAEGKVRAPRDLDDLYERVEALTLHLSALEVENRRLQGRVAELEASLADERAVRRQAVRDLDRDMDQTFGAFYDLHGSDLVGPLDQGAWQTRLFRSGLYPRPLVRKIQILLQDAGYRPGPPEGWWNLATVRALIRFQADNPLLPVTGEPDRLTRLVLFHRHLHGLDPDTVEDDDFFKSLASDAESRGRLVRQVRIALYNQGLDTGGFDMTRDTALTAHLLLFQQQAGLFPHGQLDHKTLESLFQRPVDRLAGGAAVSPPLSEEQVVWIRRAFEIRGYDPGNIDRSSWDQDVTAALLAFQRDHGLTLSVSPGPDGMTMLFCGPVGDLVRRVQEALMETGIPLRWVDGIPGPETRQALEAFQSLCGIEKTGWLDDETARRLLTAESFCAVPQQGWRSPEPVCAYDLPLSRRQERWMEIGLTGTWDAVPQALSSPEP